MYIVLSFQEDGSYKVVVNGRDLTSSPHLASQSNPLKCELDVERLLARLQPDNLCQGNADFPTLITGDKHRSPDGMIVAQEDSFTGQVTIRHVKCDLLTEKTRCDVCRMYRVNLSNRLRQQAKPDKELNLSSHTKNSVLTEEQKLLKLNMLKKEEKQAKRTLKLAQQQFSKQLDKEGVSLNDEQNEAFISIASSAELPEGSTAKMLWQQQKKYFTMNNKKQMRWHPALIRWCIGLAAKSPKAYDYLQETGYLKLPHKSTLRDYTSFTKMKPGFSADIINRLQSQSPIDKLPDFKKKVAVLWDEVRIKDGLVYNTETGALIGFCDLGDISNEIENLDSSSQEKEPSVATHIIAFMMRGIFTNTKVVFGYYPCRGFTSYQLYEAVWEGIGMLELAGYHVVGCVSDGATPNRKFYRLHGDGTVDGPCYFTDNLYREGELIYFFCDPPHLLKTTRNNFENSGWHNHTRNLQVTFIFYCNDCQITVKVKFIISLP